MLISVADEDDLPARFSTYEYNAVVREDASVVRPVHTSSKKGNYEKNACGCGVEPLLMNFRGELHKTSHPAYF